MREIILPFFVNQSKNNDKIKNWKKGKEGYDGGEFEQNN